MATMMERLDQGLEEMTRGIQSGIERGRLGLERTGLVSERTAIAAQLGILAWRQARGNVTDTERFETLCLKLDDLEVKLTAVDRRLAAAKGEKVSVGEKPAPPAAEAEAQEETPTETGHGSVR